MIELNIIGLYLNQYKFSKICEKYNIELKIVICLEWQWNKIKYWFYVFYLPKFMLYYDFCDFYMNK